MKISKLIRLSVFAFLAISLTANAQNTPAFTPKKTALTETQLQRWSHLDLSNDSIPGMSVDKAYSELLKDKKGTTVIVGIVDSGVDIEHDDLKSVVWTNKKEIPGNGKDDDKNGYIDDIHGWNFLGDITKENYEYERIANNKNLVDEPTFLKAKAANDKKFEDAKAGKSQMEMAMTATKNADEVLQKHLGKSVYTADEVAKIESSDAEIKRSKAIIGQMLNYGLPIPDLLSEIKKQSDQMDVILSGPKSYTDYRKILGDNPEDLKDTKYGNNNVIGPDKNEALHGTHVAGIVAQTRNNNIGGDGIANNVQILTARAVPDGDEDDKDISLAILYEVDNGAKVINGSFG
jgi:cell wall-associated protease